MNNIEQQIMDYRPKEFPTMTFEDLGFFYGGLTGKKKDDFKDGNAKFISYKNIYSNPSLDINTEERVKISDDEKQNTVEYGDVLFTGSSETPDECAMTSVVTSHTKEKLYLNSFCFGWRLRDKDKLLPDFMKHLFRSHHYRKLFATTANGVTRYNVSKKTLGRLPVPLPPLEVQQEIVSILDTFSDMIDNLNEELELKQKQMQHYSDVFFGTSVEELLLSKESGSVTVVPISELGSITRGKRFVRDDVREEGQPCIHYGDMYTFYGTKAYTARTFLDRDFPKKMRYAKKGDVIVVGAGENDWDIGVGMVWLGEEPAAVHDACYILEHNENAMYISYYLRSTVYHLQLRKHVSSGKISSFSGDGLGKVLIPLPSSEKQAEIVSILDTFEESIENIKEEIELRQKQYEYYREKLLTFE